MWCLFNEEKTLGNVPSSMGKVCTKHIKIIMENGGKYALSI